MLHEAIQFPKEQKGVEVIFHARKLVLYNDGEPWVKKEDGSFDDTMGAYDGVDITKYWAI